MREPATRAAKRRRTGETCPDATRDRTANAETGHRAARSLGRAQSGNAAPQPGQPRRDRSSTDEPPAGRANRPTAWQVAVLLGERACPTSGGFGGCDAALPPASGRIRARPDAPVHAPVRVRRTGSPTRQRATATAIRRAAAPTTSGPPGERLPRRAPELGGERPGSPPREPASPRASDSTSGELARPRASRLHLGEPARRPGSGLTPPGAPARPRASRLDARRAGSTSAGRARRPTGAPTKSAQRARHRASPFHPGPPGSTWRSSLRPRRAGSTSSQRARTGRPASTPAHRPRRRETGLTIRCTHSGIGAPARDLCDRGARADVQDQGTHRQVALELSPR